MVVVVVRDGLGAGVVVGVAQECDGFSFLTPWTDRQVHLEDLGDTPERQKHKNSFSYLIKFIHEKCVSGMRTTV